MAIRRSYVYTSLTAAIADTRSPLRRYLDMQFPNKKALQNKYRAESRPLLVPGGDANPATLGAAFDFAIRFVLDPNHIPEVAVDAFRGSRRRARAILEVIDVAAAAADCRTTLAPESLLRAAWALALTTEVFRSGTWRHSPLRELGWLNFKSERLLRLASPNALLQMQQLHSLATAQLFPRLPNPARRKVMGPTFEASKLCSADADFIIDGQLVELKTRLGLPNKLTGARSDSLPGKDINQLLAYALFDRSNRYSIRKIGIYSARYGNYVSWPLHEFVRLLSGREVDIAEERKIVWNLLGG